MSSLTRYVLWLYVFVVSWDTVSLPLVGSLSRVVGLAVMAIAVLAMVTEGRIRKPDGMVVFAVAFGAWTALSLLWTVSYEYTVPTVIKYAQLVASLCLIRQFVRTREQVQTLLTSFLFGSFVPLFDLLKNFRNGIEAHRGSSRFSGSNLNADMIGLVLAIGFPIAWYLFLQHRGVIRVSSLFYLVAAPFALLLTGTRGAFLAGLVALSIVPLMLPRLSLRTYAVAAVMVVLGGIALTQVPQSNWDRISTIPSEITGGGSMTGRSAIWRAGLRTFPSYEVIGAGAGAYGEAIQPYYPNTRNIFAHNMFIGLLVEVGIVGIGFFCGLLGACAWTIFRLRPPDRALWGVLMLTWLVGGMSIGAEGTKMAWVLFGLVAAQSSLPRTLDDASSVKQPEPVGVVRPYLRPAWFTRRVQTSGGR